MATYTPYEFLFTDQNTNREFVVQPYTTNGPSSPDGGIDPSAATANTTLFLYGKGAPNYGDRIQENLVYMMEHFFSTIEPSFPIPGQIWCQSSTNELTQPFQLYFFNPRKFIITNSSGNNIYVQSDDGSQSVTSVQARFTSLGVSRQFTVYSPTYQLSVFIQSALPVISGSNVMLTVQPTTSATNMAGSYIGGWEEVYSGNCEVVLRRPFNAGGFNIINLANPVNPTDAANKQYVDSAVTGGSIYLADLADVSITSPTTGQILEYNGSKWYNSSLAASYLPLAGGTMAGAINMNGYGITNVPLPVNTYDVVNKQYVDQQPLSGANVTITSPNNLDLLFYNTGTSQWNNGSAVTAGVVPISGSVTMTGALSMGGQVLTGIPTPVNPTDAANMAYVLSEIVSGSGVISGAFNNVTGVLTLNNASGPPITISGFLPTPNNLVPAVEVGYTILAPSTPPNQFFALEYGQSSPILTTLDLALNQVDTALGNFVIPRQHLVVSTSGSLTNFDINNGTRFVGLLSAPKNTYVKGSHNLQVYVNGVKQVVSTAAIAKMVSTTTIRDDFNITIAGGTFTVQVNGASPVTITIPASTGTTLGAFKNAINAMAVAAYINPVVTASGLQFTVNGNVASSFPAGTTFTVNYSGTANDTTTFTVSSSGSTYNSGITTINVTSTIPSATNAGVIFQNAWGFSASIENGVFVFRSNIAGSASTIVVTDSGVFTGIAGVTYPVSFSGASTGNSLPPADYAYYEVGMNGYLSSLFIFNVAPVNTDVVEIVIDREMVYTPTNVLNGAIIA